RLRAHEVAHRLHEPRIVEELVDRGIEVMEGLDHTDRPRSRAVLELDRGAGRLAVEIAVDLVAGARLGGSARGLRRHALGRRAQGLDLGDREDAGALEEAVALPGAALPARDATRRHRTAILRSGARGGKARARDLFLPNFYRGLAAKRRNSL